MLRPAAKWRGRQEANGTNQPRKINGRSCDNRGQAADFPHPSKPNPYSMKLISSTRRSFIGLCAAFLAFTSIGFAAGPAPEHDQRRFEIDFMKTMIDHHFGGVKMAELCAGRTIHAELKTMCDQIKAAQTEEIAKMRGWLKTWYGIDHEPRLDRKAQRQVEELSRLTGAAFEKAFMAMMIKHHSDAAKDSIECLNQAYHPEMLNMCAMMLGAQGDEIAMMRIWLMQWYGINDLDHNDRS